MVHALEIAHRLLPDGGILIDIMPMDFDQRVLIRAGRRWRHCGMMIGAGDPDVRAATRALLRVQKRGLFREASGKVLLVHQYFDSARAWKNYASNLSCSVAGPGLTVPIKQYFKSYGRSARLKLTYYLTLRVLVKV